MCLRADQAAKLTCGNCATSYWYRDWHICRHAVARWLRQQPPARLTGHLLRRPVGMTAVLNADLQHLGDSSDEDAVLSNPSMSDYGDDDGDNEEMFDANDAAAEEGYERATPAGGAGEGEDDDNDDAHYSEATENNKFSTPAGSFAGDFAEEHVIDEMHRTMEDAIAAQATARNGGSGASGSTAVGSSATGSSSAQASAIPPASRSLSRAFSMDAQSALSSLNFIVKRNAIPDKSILDGVTPNTLRPRIEELVKSNTSGHIPEEHIDRLADALQEVVAGREDPEQGEPAEQKDEEAHAPEQATANTGGNGIHPPALPAASATRPQESQEAGQQPQQQPQPPAVPPPQQSLPPPPRQESRTEQQQQQEQAEARAMPNLPARPTSRQASSGSAGPSLPLRGSGGLGPSLPPRIASGAGPSLPPRQPRQAPPRPAAGGDDDGGAPAAAAEAVAEGSQPESQAPRTNGAGPSVPARGEAGAGPSLPGQGAASSGGAASTQQPAQGGAMTGGSSAGGAAGGSGGGNQPPANGAGPSVSASAAAAEEVDDETADVRRRVQALRVMLLRIVGRLGVNAQSSVVQQVLMRLDMAERIRVSRRGPPRPQSIESARAEASAAEAAADSEADLPFKCTVMLLGLSGCGKSSIVNSLLGYKACETDAFSACTKKVQIVEGSIKGIQMRFIDTPGLQLSPGKIAFNQSILAQAKRASKKHKPDIVLYVDRMDMLRRPTSDLPVLRQITSVLGANTWFNTVLVMTHAAKPPPDGPAGPMDYSTYINHRMNALQNGVRVAAGDYRLMNPAALAETHPNCRKDTNGEPLLPNGTPWRQQLLMLGLSSKLLVDAEKALDIQKRESGGGTGGGNAAITQQLAMFRPAKLPPIPYLLSGMIQPRKPRKFLEDEQDICSEKELAKLPLERRKAQHRKRRQYLSQRAAEQRAEDEGQGQAPVAVPGPGLPLQPSFDPEPGYDRYRALESPSGWVAQAFVEPTTTDHDDGVEGMMIQRTGVMRPKHQHLGGLPAHIQGQLQKDKNSFSLIGEGEVSTHHSRKVVSTSGVDFQTVGQDHLWVVRSETRAKGLPLNNRVAMGGLAARLVDGGGAPTKGPVVFGAKLEDRVRLRRGLKAVMSGGIMKANTRNGKEVAYAANARLQGLHGIDQSTVIMLETSLMKFRNDLAIGGNLSAQGNITPETQVSGRANLNTKNSGQVTVRVTSHDKGELAWAFVAPVLGVLWRKIRPPSGDGFDL